MIGTPWSVDDRLCVDMAKGVYEALRENVSSNGTVNDEAVSSGLHHAIRELRDRWV